MNEIKELIDKFWAKEINSDEQHKLLEFISKDAPELKSTLKADFDLELSSGKNKITEKRFQNILAQLHDRLDSQVLQPEVKVFTLNHWVRLIAALVIVALAAVLYINRDHTSQRQDLAATHLKAVKEVLRQPYNSGNTAITINLSDGSRVTLQPESSLSYYEPFDSKSRNISMKGEATFKVAKDKHHPFIVNANGFTTTALGTEFTINTTKQNRVTVKLLEGKVVVKASSESNMHMNDVYLVPGEQLSINTKLKAHTLTNFHDPVKAAKVHTNLIVPARAALVFNETPLSEVFNSLSKRYTATLVYDGTDEAELQKLYFTGTVAATEKLSTILPVICNMNGLTFKQTDNSIIISKQK